MSLSVATVSNRRLALGQSPCPGSKTIEAINFKAPNTVVTELSGRPMSWLDKGDTVTSELVAIGC